MSTVTPCSDRKPPHILRYDKGDSFCVCIACSVCLAPAVQRLHFVFHRSSGILHKQLQGEMDHCGGGSEKHTGEYLNSLLYITTHIHGRSVEHEAKDDGCDDL